ncbi:MAG: excinuclease ABC subunit UvrC, partial [Chloroflexi bacterium]|nr:excinuclease ABC subunit UvrC [Chloroflexota bacterium]
MEAAAAAADQQRGWVMIANVQHIPDLVRALPELPGVYLMKDTAGTVIYVGKAVSLRNRVRSYFQSPDGHTPKTRQLVARITDFEYIVTESEQGALILENTLIKRYQPKYNVMLKDDKTYPYLKINLHEPWPQVFITRKVEQDGARYFGPYTDTGSVRRTMELIKRLFPYRSCTKPITGTDERACLDFHIHRCLGPCIGAVNEDDYKQVIQQVILFLEGRQEEVVKDLRQKMDDAADNLEFERAAFLRDQIRSVERVIERQKLVLALEGDQDAVAFTQEDNECCVQVFFIRGGKLFGREHFMMEGVRDETPSHIMTEFVQQFYEKAPNIPPSIFLQHPLENPAIIEKWLSERAGVKVETRVPQRGDKKKLVEMAAENAHHTLMQLRVKWLSDQGKTASALEQLRESLSLPRMPRRMECYDISSIQGTSKVGSMVVFQDGRPRNIDYRRFKIKEVEGNNDYASMQEMLRRRFKRAGFQSRMAMGANGVNGAVAEAPDDDDDDDDILRPEADELTP